MRHVLLLRGINLGRKRRVPMAELRGLLGEAGYEDVTTYVQSGNVVLSSPAKPRPLESAVAKLISEQFGFEVPVIVRTRAELARVVAGDPFGAVAHNPKLYQVSFLDSPLNAERVARVREAAVSPEQVEIGGREIYAWHPDGVARSKLATLLSGRGLGVTATARNWSTVLALLELASA